MTDYKLVPVEPTAEMVEAAQDAYMPFGDMDIALRMAIFAAPAVQGEPVEYGWRLIAVNEAWDALERALSRACNKGYMPVTMGAEWNAFDWTEAPQPTEQQPAPAVQGEPVGRVKTVGGYPDESEHTVEWLCKYRDLKDGDLLYTAPQPAEQQPALAKYQPCGCVVCTCEHETQCQGCGAHHCGTHPLGQIPGPVYQQPAPDVAGLVEALERLVGYVERATHVEFGGTLWLKEKMAEIGYARAALAAHRKQQEGDA